MTNYKLLLEYDGSDFFGWQVQPGLRTVQGELERAIEVLVKEKVNLICAGRTDRGVHALGQVANFKAAREMEPGVVLRALNAITPKDIVVRQVEVVEDDFHARFSAVARQYIYYLSLRPIAIGRHYAFYFPHVLDFERMKEASSHLLGEHNFEAFSKKMPEEKHYRCDVEAVEWVEEDHRIGFRIRANRFVHHMVRIILGTLLQVGRGILSVDQFKAILDQGDRRHPGFKAPPHGLFLEKIYY